MQRHLLGWINWGMIEKTRQDLETNIRSSDKSEWTIEAKLTWVTEETTRRAWRHTFTKSDRRQEGLSKDVNECWPYQTGLTLSSTCWLVEKITRLSYDLKTITIWWLISSGGVSNVLHHQLPVFPRISRYVNSFLFHIQTYFNLEKNI